MNHAWSTTESCPDCVARNKILPQLINAFEYSNAGSAILAPVFKIGKKLDSKEYQGRRWPICPNKKKKYTYYYQGKFFQFLVIKTPGSGSIYIHTWDTWWLVSRASGRGVVDTSVDPLWSAFRHSCWFFLSPKYRLPPGCGFCSFFTIFVFCSFCNVLLPFYLPISFLPGFFMLPGLWAFSWNVGASLQPEILDPDPYQMNMDPQPRQTLSWAYGSRCVGQSSANGALWCWFWF